jgi:protease IV
MEPTRESIFVSSLRGFCRALFIMFGFFAALFLAFFLFSIFGGSYRPTQKTTLEILPDLNNTRQLVSLSAPVILQIKIHGVIGDLVPNPNQRVTSEDIQNILVESREGFLHRDRVKGVLLYFDTPGGSVTDSDNIYRMLVKYKELYKVPVFGYIDGMCASGGMYIASAADRLFCGPVGVVGSVGVVSGPFFNVFDALTRWGVKSKTITEGLDKDMMNPMRPWKADEDANLQALMSSFYQQFVDLVTMARPRLDRNKLINEYGAKIYDGVRAQEYGYVDVANSSYEAALLALIREAQIDLSLPYQVVELKAHRGLLASLADGSSGLNQIEHRIQLGSDRPERFAYLYNP